MADGEADRRTVHVRVEGRVQGVYFRAWTQENARELGLSGWVRNRRDGSVEALFSGAEGAIDDMLKRLKNGPPGASVRSVEIIQDGGAAPGGFQIKSTA